VIAQARNIVTESASADQVASERRKGGGAVPGRYGAATVIGRPGAGRAWTGTVEPAAGPAESRLLAAGHQPFPKQENAVNHENSDFMTGDHNDFVFDMGDRVQMAESDEVGTVIGRAEHLTSENSYLVRYCAGDGRQTESWWGESAIIDVDTSCTGRTQADA